MVQRQAELLSHPLGDQRAVTRLGIALDYPPVDDAHDLVSHPHTASGGRVIASVAGRRVTATSKRGEITVPLGKASTLTVLAAFDRYGNRAAQGGT